MASLYKLESREQRIERMAKDNPDRSIELCTAVVDSIWEEKRQNIIKQIPFRFQKASLIDFKDKVQQITEAVSRVFSPPKENSPVGLIFCGPVGSGKTHAAYSVIQWLIQINPEMIAFMGNYPEVIQSVKDEFINKTTDEIGSVWDRLNNESGLYDGLVFLDDVFSSKSTDFGDDKFLAFLNNRFDNYLPFMLTTNVPVEDFPRLFGERIASRLLGYCDLVDISGEDKRINND